MNRAPGFQLLSRKRGGAARYMARRPRPLKVEAADSSVAIEHLANHIQSRYAARFQCPVIDLIQRHAARRDLGKVPATIAGDWQLESGKRMDQLAPLLARYLTRRKRRIDAAIPRDCRRQPIRNALR